jgi:iron complex outermembrane recepter protein
LVEHLRIKPGQVDLNNALDETSDPKHEFSVRSSLNLPMHSEWDAGLRWVDTLHNNSGAVPGTVPSYFELNSRLAWHLGKQLELSVVGENLLHNHHPEYGFPGASRIEIERSVFGRLAWWY